MVTETRAVRESRIDDGVDGGEASEECLAGKRGKRDLCRATFGEEPNQHLNLDLDGIDVDDGHELNAGSDPMTVTHHDAGDPAGEWRLYLGTSQLNFRSPLRNLRVVQSTPGSRYPLSLFAKCRVKANVVTCQEIEPNGTVPP